MIGSFINRLLISVRFNLSKITPDNQIQEIINRLKINLFPSICQLTEGKLILAAPVFITGGVRTRINQFTCIIPDTHFK